MYKLCVTLAKELCIIICLCSFFTLESQAQSSLAPQLKPLSEASSLISNYISMESSLNGDAIKPSSKLFQDFISISEELPGHTSYQVFVLAVCKHASSKPHEIQRLINLDFTTEEKSLIQLIKQNTY